MRQCSGRMGGVEQREEGGERDGRTEARRGAEGRRGDAEKEKKHVCA